MSEITTIEEAAEAAALVFRKQGWTYGLSPTAAADVEEIEATIRRLVFHSAFGEEEPSNSVESGRFFVTRDSLGPSEDSRSVYLHLFDI